VRAEVLDPDEPPCREARGVSLPTEGAASVATSTLEGSRDTDGLDADGWPGVWGVEPWDEFAVTSAVVPRWMTPFGFTSTTPIQTAHAPAPARKRGRRRAGSRRPRSHSTTVGR